MIKVDLGISSLYDYKFGNLSTYPFSIFMAFLRVTLGFSVSGQKSLATARDAGADMTEAVSKCVEDTCGKEEAHSVPCQRTGSPGRSGRTPAPSAQSYGLGSQRPRQEFMSIDTSLEKAQQPNMVIGVEN